MKLGDSAMQESIDMAGDWIKMRTALANDPAVIAIALDLDKSEFEVVGMLHHLWSWADSQSEDGHIKRVTEKWIDRYVHQVGFSKSMVSAGWLIVKEDGITFPNFERHNGESAKKRAEAAERQRISRENRKLGIVTDSSQDSCDKGVTREEKRREENKDQKPMSSDEPSDVQKVEKIPYKEILDLYHAHLKSLPKVRMFDEARKKAIRSRWSVDARFQNLEFWEKFFSHIDKSDFLMGRTNTPWNGCCFDWIFKPANFKKIVEGNYN
ncbi:hypothetical protein Q9L58_010697, partial [Maublancomyces gigas]